ncbi:14-alpha sterol demethylase Cyp51B [Microthyrium microscopicum]|uniref:14-alpha sterol demethylase Cyp51B n=1 Tax=Microthyrium microscopicum TaxID=703497 RepID=A0A6A6TW60_9PEZI|nr:14-alpha sterol demethylase Cyp51B [Microthyrium microscopicum]
MGLLASITEPLSEHFKDVSTLALLVCAVFAGLCLIVVANVLQQQLFRNKNEPPVVFHWFPVIGSTITYGMDPMQFFKRCQAQYGDIFTFVLLGRRMTVYLGTKGNEFILNAKLKDANAEEIYSPLTTPVFGKDVVYDCPNSKLMEQKKFVKFGLTTEAFRSYVSLIADEVESYVKKSPKFKAEKGVFDVTSAMAELTIFTASRSLQGKEVRERFDATFADYYHDLDMGFSPINFMLPWAPLPHNRRRDVAHHKMVETYMGIITKRREGGNQGDEEDMIGNLMGCSYKDGKAIPDKEIAHMMIALLMAGQHSSSSSIAWIILHLADRPDITEELLEEQKTVLGNDLPRPTYDDLSRLPLHSQVIKESLRMHSPIHSIMRKVKTPMHVEGTNYIIPTSHTLLATPIYASLSPFYFPNPSKWEPHRWDDGSSGTNLPEEGEGEKVDYGYGMVTKGTTSPYLPFGAGRHRCIGEQFAYVQLQTILVIMVRIFKFQNLPGRDGVVATDYSSLFSRPMAPASVIWEKRDKQND